MGGQVDEGRLVAGRYRLLERIGRGGMGTVWRAEDELLGRQVAVKKIHPPQPHMDDDELATVFERTRREARAAARISHPNVIVVHDVVDDAGLPSIVMEYVPSATLGERLKEQGPLPPAEAARIGRGMVAALRAAHRAGVLHRDVKPGNVLLGEDDRVVLTDFGIAQASGTSTLTRTGELIGSIDFLSPERIRGALPGPEADLWALGATLYQAVEGESPFRRPTAIETAYAIAEEPVRTPLRAGALAEVIAGLLVKEPAERLSAEVAEQMLRIPAAEQETALVDRGRLDSPARGPEPPAESAAGPPAPNYTHPVYGGPPHTRNPPYTQGPHTPNPLVQNPHTPSPYDPPTGSSQPHPLYGPPPYTQSTPPPYSSPGSGRPRRRRIAPWIAAAVAVAVLGAGVVVVVQHLRTTTEAGGDGGPTGAPGPVTSGPVTPVTTPPTTPTTPTSAPTTEPPPVPDGYHLAEHPDHGYSVPVPDGWTEKVSNGGDQVDYIDPTKLVDLKLSALDFAATSPYEHFKNLEPDTGAQVDAYHRERLDPTTKSGDPAAIWEFTFQGSVRKYHAIDLGFGKPGGTEYAVYLSAPDSQWQEYRAVFDTVLAGFRQSG
ncbi:MULTISPECIES: serine/threonine-protein kinase [unclassified Streptomyces]|uniref:serine/threonine-protein kinase n=1 Tax=unclassified Streptomyces TaxID=2593676 RepID=UPI002E28173D|nr:protein kinase [Streptomyces sp. NBC_00223]